MILGIGTDIIEIDRIRKSVERYSTQFLNRLFHPSEQTYCLKRKDPIPGFAARFAGKEAIVKALGVGFSDGIDWLDFEIINDLAGKPLVRVSKKIEIKFSCPHIHLSLSHCKTFATAYAVWTSQTAGK